MKQLVKRDLTIADVGWCHQCGTLQLYGDAPMLDVYWCFQDHELRPCCYVCRQSEPWELGVWDVDQFDDVPDSLVDCAQQRHVTWSPNKCEECSQ